MYAIAMGWISSVELLCAPVQLSLEFGVTMSQCLASTFISENVL